MTTYYCCVSTLFHQQLSSINKNRSIQLLQISQNNIQYMNYLQLFSPYIKTNLSFSLKLTISTIFIIDKTLRNELKKYKIYSLLKYKYLKHALFLQLLI